MYTWSNAVTRTASRTETYWTQPRPQSTYTKDVHVQGLIFFLMNIHVSWHYSETCLNRPPHGPKNVVSEDKWSLVAGSITLRYIFFHVSGLSRQLSPYSKYMFCNCQITYRSCTPTPYTRTNLIISLFVEVDIVIEYLHKQLDLYRCVHTLVSYP